MEYRCKTTNCAISLANAKFAVSMNCPVCQQILVEEKSEVEISIEDLALINSLPYVIAYPLQQTLLEKNGPQRLNYFRDTFLNYLKYLGLLTASEFFNSPFKERKIVDLFLQNLAQPSFGSWNAFTRECLQYLKNQNHTFFCPDLAAYYETVETGKKRKMYNGEIEVVDSYNGGEIKYIKQQATAIGMLINFRNRYLGHGLTLDAATSEKLFCDYFPIFRTLLDKLTFCEKFPMLKQEATVYYSLQGIEVKPIEPKVKIDSNVSIYNIETNASMPIIPFFIIPGELAIESDGKANVMSYESNNGKTITFFSPEGITKQTSGKLLERLNLLLRDKQKEIPYTPETFTKEVFLERIAEENELMLKSLLNEKKVIEGIYQHREDIEIKLREWIGALANIFFISAEAGSGKTNLLVEIQKQYTQRNLSSLFIRASRMEKPSLKEELCYQLNLDSTLNIAQYITLAGTQAEPTFVLIDGLNEAHNAETIWQEILEISTAFEPGSLKFIITSRANTKTDLERYAITEKQMQYLYGENKDHENSLAAHVFWLTPLDMKEMEAAWNSYVAKDKNRFKPLFSFNDIATFDRALYLQINNPLVLRIFLETYRAKNLPKKGAKHLHIWKDWLATFSVEEQNFMRLLANVVWQQCENELLLDNVTKTENLQNYILNDNDNAPYKRLITLGWISRYAKDFTTYISFTVEGLLLHLLGTKLNHQSPAPSSEAIGDILTKGTRLQKAAIESFLCEQALNGKIDLIAQLIDEGDEKLDLCVTPLLYFIKYQGVENTIEKLLENPTENDWRVILKLDELLDKFQHVALRKEFLFRIMLKNTFQQKESIILGLRTIHVIEVTQEAKNYFEKIEPNLQLIMEDVDFLIQLGEVEDKLGNYDKAIKYYQNSIKIEENIFGKNKINLPIIFSHLGKTYYEKQEFDKSLEYNLKSLNVTEKSLEEISPSFLASIYNNIGGAYGCMFNYEKAIEYLEKSLGIRSKFFGKYDFFTININTNIGMIYGKMGLYDKALERLLDSLEISLKTFGADNRNSNLAEIQISLVLENYSDNKIALKFLLRQLNIEINTLGKKNTYVASTLSQMGLVCVRIKEYQKAYQYYFQSAEMLKEFFGEDDFETQESIANVLRLAKELGKESELPEWVRNTDK